MPQIFIECGCPIIRNSPADPTVGLAPWEIWKYCGTRYGAAAVSACLELCRSEDCLDRILETIGA